MVTNGPYFFTIILLFKFTQLFISVHGVRGRPMWLWGISFEEKFFISLSVFWFSCIVLWIFLIFVTIDAWMSLHEWFYPQIPYYPFWWYIRLYKLLRTKKIQFLYLFIYFLLVTDWAHDVLALSLPFPSLINSEA